MRDFVVQELAAGTEWRNLLSAYHRPVARKTDNDSNTDGWLPRIASLDGVEPGRLAQLHGKLIALGFLRFEISGTAGVQYQLSPLGRQTLERGLDFAPDAENADAPEARSDD